MVYDWSTTPASNATVGSINWAEGQAPSTVNNSSREEMADVAKWRDSIGGANISSGTDTITLTSGLSVTAYAQGQIFAFEAGGANTGAVTLNVDTVGAKAIKKNHDVDLVANDIEAGGIYVVAYEATADNFQLISPVSNAALTSADIGSTVQGYDADNAVTDVAQEFTATQNFNATTLTDGATINWDASANQFTTVTLGGNRTVAAPTNLVDGGCYVLGVFQDGVGSHTLTWNAVFKWPSATAPTLTTTASAKDYITFVSDGTNLYNVGIALNVS